MSTISRQSLNAFRFPSFQFSTGFTSAQRTALNQLQKTLDTQRSQFASQVRSLRAEIQTLRPSARQSISNLLDRYASSQRQTFQHLQSGINDLRARGNSFPSHAISSYLSALQLQLRHGGADSLLIHIRHQLIYARYQQDGFGGGYPYRPG
jgi:uncharacterized protein (DUF3084 family)